MSSGSGLKQWISNDLLVRTITIEGVIEIREPLRVGAGKSDTLTSTSDLPVLKLRFGEEEIPVIPGSSWKGVFRSRVESHLKTYGKKVCGGPGDTCMDRGNLKQRLEQLQRRPSESSRQEIISILSRDLCLACKIFGAPSYISKVHFSDSYPLMENGTYMFTLGRKPGIAISRKTGAVRRGAFYNVEFVEPGSRFTFRLDANNLPNYALGFIAKTLTELHEGILRVGGFKTRGFGRIAFVDITHSVSGLAPELNADQGKVLKGFTDRSKLWFDEEDSDVTYDGSTWDLLNKLSKLADEWLEQGREGNG